MNITQDKVVRLKQKEIKPAQALALADLKRLSFSELNLIYTENFSEVHLSVVGKL